MLASLVNRFERQGRPAFAACTIRLGRDRRTCDLGVFQAEPPLRTATHVPAAFATVVEVVPEDSRMRDHIDKPRGYAAAGIPEYWIEDEHPEDEADGMISIFRLELTGEGTRYQLRQRQSVRELLAS